MYLGSVFDQPSALTLTLGKRFRSERRWVCNASHYLQPVSPGRTLPHRIMDEQKSFLVGDVAEVLTGPFHRRLCVVLGQDEKTPLFLVAVYYPSENFFIHTYLAAEQMRVIGHMADTSE
jgi:hypothetical protein